MSGAAQRGRVILAQCGWPYGDEVYLPTAVAALAAAAKADPAFAALYEIDPHLRYAREDPAQMVAGFAEPAVLGLSMYVWTERISLEVARLTKERWPDCLVVLGGGSVSGWEWRTPERLLRAHPWVDVVVDGEGEFAFREVCVAWANGRRAGLKAAALPGVAFLDEGSYVQGAERPRQRDLSLFPSPFLDGTLDAVMEHGRGKGVRFAAVFEGSRGCPFKCAFCFLGERGRQQDVRVPVRSSARGTRVDRAKRDRVRLPRRLELRHAPA